MKPHRVCVALVCVGTGLLAAAPQPDTERGALWRALPLVGDLPSGSHPIGTMNGRGEFHAPGGLEHRVDDGDAHHGLPATVAWAASPKDRQAQAQGVLYGVEDGRIVSAGYLIRQADLVAGQSFHGLTLRGLDFPAAHSLTIELLDEETAGSRSYLWLWHFLPQPDHDPPMLRSGELPLLTSLPATFTVVRNDAYPNDFYPRMGRHRRDTSTSRTRLPTGTGRDSVWYGEAAGKLIFIEYIFDQQDLAAGASWFHLPLNGVPIPPIDNVHLLHYNGARPGAPGLYTAHMYFLPEEQYLSWETEPPVL